MFVVDDCMDAVMRDTNAVLLIRLSVINLDNGLLCGEGDWPYGVGTSSRLSLPHCMKGCSPLV